MRMREEGSAPGLLIQRVGSDTISNHECTGHTGKTVSAGTTISANPSAKASLPQASNLSAGVQTNVNYSETETTLSDTAVSLGVDIISSSGTINAIGSSSIGFLNRSVDSLISGLNINTSELLHWVSNSLRKGRECSRII